MPCVLPPVQAEELGPHRHRAQVVGYYESWQTPPSKINFAGLTNLNYVSLIGKSDGSLDQTHINFDALPAVRAGVHGTGGKLSILIDQRTPYITIANDKAAASAFAANIVKFASDNGFDGIDLDWEPDWHGPKQAEIVAYGTLIGQVYTHTHSKGLLLSAAVSEQFRVVPAANISQLDFIEVMCYDMNLGAGHTDYQASIKSMNGWVTYGVPKRKLLLGVPFYGRTAAAWAEVEPYGTMIANAGGSPPVAGANQFTDPANGKTWYYSGPDELQRKSHWVLDNSFGGVAIWEMDGDAFTLPGGKGVLAKAVSDVMISTARTPK